MLVPALSSSKRGVFLGKVTAVRQGRILVELAGSVKRGDGVAFDCGRPVDDEQGGRVYEVFQTGRSLTEPISRGTVELTFAHGGINFDEVWPGQQVWKTDDPQLTSRLRKSFTGNEPLRRIGLSILATAAVGEPLRLIISTANGVQFDLATPEPLAAAQKHSLSEAVLGEQLGRLGGTPYELTRVTATITGSPMVPFSVLGKLRHEMLARLEAAATTPPLRRIATDSVVEGLRDAPSSGNASPVTGDTTPQIHVLCRSLSQLREVTAWGIKSVYVDFQDIREYRPAVAHARDVGAKIFLATPRIQKPDEVGIFRMLLKQGADGILVRNLGGLAFCGQRGTPLIADFSLNCTNEITAQYLRGFGAQRLTASYDLNRDQLLELVASVSAAELEVVVHQHMPMFHMEHCVFCAVLSPGTNKTNCGRPCDRHAVKLRDHIGMEHTLTADVGCRNTLFNAVPQSAAEVVPELRKRGVRHFRLELLGDQGSGLHQLLNLYGELLAGSVTGKEVWSRLNATNGVGVTRGTLEERRNPLAIL